MDHKKSKTRTREPYVVERRGGCWYVVHCRGGAKPKRIGPVDKPGRDNLAIAVRERDRKNRCAKDDV